MSWSKPISEWACATFGAATPSRALDRTDDEFCELLEEQSAEEAADVVICLCGFAAAKGFDLAAAVEAKMAINRARRWKLNGDGTGQHVPAGFSLGKEIEPGVVSDEFKEKLAVLGVEARKS